MKRKFYPSICLIVGFSLFTTYILAQNCPTLTVTPDTTVCPNVAFTLSSAVSSGTVVSTQWSPAYGLSSTTVPNPTAAVAKDTTYYVTVTTRGTTNLITNGDFSAGNTGFNSGYTYSTAGNQPCPSSFGVLGCDGYYTINTNPNNAHSNFFSFGDHTTGSGNMLLVNGSTNPNINVWCQTITVQPNTNYEFSAWVTNVQDFDDPLPNLRFFINGGALGTVFSPSEFANDWQRFFVIWNSGTNTSVNICLNNSNASAGGNDFGLDDISFIPVCTLRDTVHVLTYKKPVFTLGADTTFCDTVHRVFNPTVTGTGTLTYRWQDNSTATTYTADQPGLYWLQVSNQCSNSAVRDSVVLTRILKPTVSLGADTLVCNQPSYQITPVTTGATPLTYQWQDGTTTATYTAMTDNIYRVDVTNICGTARDSVRVAFLATPATAIVSPADTTICSGTSVALSIAPQPAYDTLTWQDMTTHGASYTATTAGTYWVEVRNTCGAVRDSTTVRTMTLPAASTLGPPDTTICAVTSVVFAPTPSQAGVTYLWQDNTTTTPSYTATTAGLYTVQISNKCGTVADSIRLHIKSAPPAFSIGSNAGLCVGDSLTLRQNPIAVAGDSLVWQDFADHTDSFIARGAGQYVLREINACGMSQASVTITALPLPSVSFAALPVYCDADSVLLDPVVTDVVAYQWYNGATDTAIYVKSSGTYTTTVTNGCGSVIGSIAVRLLTSAVRPFNGMVVDSCMNAKVPLDAMNAGKTFVWSTGQGTQAISVSTVGSYYVTISDQGDCPVTDTVYVVEHSCDEQCRVAAPTAFTPNGDGKNDRFKTMFECTTDSYEIRIYNRWGELVYINNDMMDGWDGVYKNVQQPVGVYAYTLKYRNASTKEEKVMTGNFTLLR